MAYRKHSDKRAHVHSLSQTAAASYLSFDLEARKELFFFSAQRIHFGIQNILEPFYGYDGLIVHQFVSGKLLMSHKKGSKVAQVVNFS